MQLPMHSTQSDHQLSISPLLYKTRSKSSGHQLQISNQQPWDCLWLDSRCWSLCLVSAACCPCWQTWIVESTNDLWVSNYFMTYKIAIQKMELSANPNKMQLLVPSFFGHWTDNLVAIGYVNTYLLATNIHVVSYDSNFPSRHQPLCTVYPVHHRVS